VTTFSYENFHPSVHQFEQDILYYLTLAPYLLTVGVVATIALTQRYSIYGLLLPVGFASCIRILVIRDSNRFSEISWIDFLPDMTSRWCLPPIYLVGIEIGNFLRNLRRPYWRITDLFWAMTIVCILCYAVANRPYMVIPTVFFVLSLLLAYRMFAKTFGVTHEARKQGE
jgi:hypothetical protein